MASTNKTINYDLSQYLANDKPTYLVDYNSDMNKIDTQMKANNDLAGLAKTEADDLSSRVDGQDIIIGNLNTTVGQHTSDISTLNTNVSAVNTKVGDLTNLNTTDKTDVVSAVNEVNTKVGDLTNLATSSKTNVVSAINENVTKINTKLNKGTIIWTNPDPSQPMGSISIDISDVDLTQYDSFSVITEMALSSDLLYSTSILPLRGTRILSANAGQITWRDLIIDKTNKQINISDGKQPGASGGALNNDAIPLYIIFYHEDLY